LGRDSILRNFSVIGRVYRMTKKAKANNEMSGRAPSKFQIFEEMK